MNYFNLLKFAIFNSFFIVMCIYILTKRFESLFETYVYKHLFKFMFITLLALINIFTLFTHNYIEISILISISMFWIVSSIKNTSQIKLNVDECMLCSCFIFITTYISCIICL